MKPEKKKKNPNPVVVDSRRKRRSRMIDLGKEVDMRAQGKGTSIEEQQQNWITIFLILSI